MGRNHLRVFRELGDVDVVGLCDTDEATAGRLSALHGVPTYRDHRELLAEARPEAVTVAVPTGLHHQVAADALRAGCHVLVEKPIASTVEAAERLVRLAAEEGRVLAVGHIERFNAALIELKRRLDGGELGSTYQIHARRLGPFPHRIRDVGVVIDLATHDLDIMRHLSGSEPVRVFAEANRHIHTSNEDLVCGQLRFQNGMLGLLEINWLTPTKIRELTVTGQRGMFQVDQLTQDLYFYENREASAASWDSISVLRGVNEGAMTRFALEKSEPLQVELAGFLSAAAGGPGQIVSGQDGLRALELALAMIRSAETNQVVVMP